MKFFSYFVLIVFAWGSLFPQEKPAVTSLQDTEEIDIEIQKYIEKITKEQFDPDEEKLKEVFSKERPQNDTRKIVFYNISDSELEQRLKNSGRNIETYKIKQGDTLHSIASKNNMTLSELLELNPQLQKRNTIFVGEEIRVYGTYATQQSSFNPWQEEEEVKVIEKKHTVKKGDTLTKIAATYKVSVKDIMQLNKLNEKSILKPGKELLIERYKIIKKYRVRNIFIRPVNGAITSYFGMRNNPFLPGVRSMHKGIDIAADLGTPIRAARDGIVIFSGRMEGYGNCVFIRHQDQYITVYAHNKVNHVKVGDIVYQGQIIGEVGRTGYATGPHLHFEIRKLDKALNPLHVLNLEEKIEISTQKVALR